MSWLLNLFAPYYQLRHALTPSFDVMVLIALVYFVMTFYTAWMISAEQRVKKEKYGTQGWGETFWIVIFSMGLVIPFGIWFITLFLPFIVFIGGILFFTHVPVKSIIEKQSPITTIRNMFKWET